MEKKNYTYVAMALMFIAIVLYVFNIGSIGYLFYIGKPQFAIASIVVQILASGKVWKMFKILT